MGRVEGKVAIISGAASGLGAEIAILLAMEGAKTVVADIDESQGLAVVDRIRQKGCEAHYMHLDVSNEASWAQVMEETKERFRKLNILVNNAGIAPSGSIDMDLELWRKVISINLDGTFLGTKHAIRTIRQCGERGSIVNISSIMAMVANSTTAAYCASKGGVRSLTKAAAMYCAEQKLPIRVNSIHPGTCMTPLVKSFYDSQPPSLLQAQIQRHPIGHLGEPLDVAYGVLYLASEESKFVLGSELTIDGGLLASD